MLTLGGITERSYKFVAFATPIGGRKVMFALPFHLGSVLGTTLMCCAIVTAWPAVAQSPNISPTDQPAADRAAALLFMRDYDATCKILNAHGKEMLQVLGDGMLRDPRVNGVVRDRFKSMWSLGEISTGFVECERDKAKGLTWRKNIQDLADWADAHPDATPEERRHRMEQ